MKHSQRGIIALGIILFAASAVCIVSLMLQFLDFGSAVQVQGSRSYVYVFGRMLFSVYGFSSLLIPLYLFGAGVVLFSAQWSKKKGVYLVCSVIPFLTVAAIEFFAKKIFIGTSFTVSLIRTVTFILLSLLLCLIEYVVIGLIAERIEHIVETAAKAHKKFFAVKKGFTDYLPQDKTIAEDMPFDDTDEAPIDEDGLPDDKFGGKNNAIIDDEREAAFLGNPFDFEVVEEENTSGSSYNQDGGLFSGHGASGIDNGETDEIDEIDEIDAFSAADESDEDDIDESESNDEHDVENENENAAERYGTSSPLIPAVPKRQKNKPYNVPAEGLLTTYPDGEYWVIDEETKRSAQALKETLNEFRIEAEVTGIRKGPVVTMFEILPAPGVKLSKIVALGDNIALRLAASSVRIVAPIPGKHAVGIEVPNRERAIVSFKELIDTDIPAFKKMAIPVVLGKDIAGDAQVLDLSKTPHLLIAGSTGSGKSVCVNSLILSILYKRPPQDVRMILIDPKIVELKLYNDIPHLLTPVITEPKKAFQALQYCLCEMERRYALLDGMGVRDIASYNKRIVERKIAAEKLPYIVLIVDEFADLMATTGKELESTVARLAAMSRAVGIHLVLATQRPSIDVITGLIKANIPTRIAFMVASKMDSRIIIDQVGAEKLLGKGDMLYASAVDPFPIRIQGTFVSDTEVENVVDYVKQYGEPDYIDDEIFVDDEEENFDPGVFGDGEDPLYEKALEIVMQAGKASASYIQRRLKIGYNRAARLVEDMEARGIVGPANGSKPREVLHVV